MTTFLVSKSSFLRAFAVAGMFFALMSGAHAQITLDTSGGPQVFGVAGGAVGDWNSSRLNVYNNMVVGGSLQLGSTTATCSASNIGTLRWNPSNGKVEVCNGTAWGGLSSKPVQMANISAHSSSSASPDTENSISVYDLCVLSQTNIQDNGSHVHAQCQVSPHGDGTWDLNASLTVGYITCNMLCYNFQ